MKHDGYDPAKYADLPMSEEGKKILEKGREALNLYNRKILPFNLNERT
jgi:hypothetical protein